jgi:acyl-CoA thioester hydrolase
MPAPFILSITATPTDIDELGHVNNAVWVKWIQKAATAHWTAAATPEQIAAWVWVVVRHEIDYLGNVTAGETVIARTWISEAPRGARFNRNIEFTGPDRRVKVKSVSTWALIDRASGRVARVPKDVVAHFMGEKQS